MGTSRAAILRRLRHDHPQLYELVLSGEITPFRAACVAGFRKAPGKKPSRPVDPTEDGHSEVLLELWLGPNESRGSLFETVEELREAWLANKTQVMERWGTRGRRPMGWWEFEAGDLEHPGYEAEPRFLFEHGLLSADERRELEAAASSR